MAGLKVDWQHVPMYNTVMSVAAGVGLLLLVDFGRSLAKRSVMVVEGWALAFGTLGVILTFLGGAMTVTWPLSGIAPRRAEFLHPHWAHHPHVLTMLPRRLS